MPSALEQQVTASATAPRAGMCAFVSYVRGGLHARSEVSCREQHTPMALLNGE
jgi:hypothetical protein